MSIERVVVTEHGRRKTITKLEAVTKQLVKQSGFRRASLDQATERVLRQWDDPTKPENITIVIDKEDVGL